VRVLKILLLVIGLMILSLSGKAYSEIPSRTGLSTIETNIRTIKTIAKQEGVNEAICLAIAKGESGFKTYAFNDNKKGKGQQQIRQSHGLFQLTIATGKTFGIKSIEELYQAEKNARAGIRFIKHLLIKYPQQSIYNIAQMYNLGETRFRRGKTAQTYASRFMLYYYGFKSAPMEGSGVYNKIRQDVHSHVRGNNIQDGSEQRKEDRVQVILNIQSDKRRHFYYEL
jgi:hypothetical protein